MTRSFLDLTRSVIFHCKGNLTFYELLYIFIVHYSKPDKLVFLPVVIGGVVVVVVVVVVLLLTVNLKYYYFYNKAIFFLILVAFEGLYYSLHIFIASVPN